MSPPSVLVTRRIPSSALERLAERCEVDLHDGADGLSPEALRERAEGKSALVSMVTDRIDAALLDAAPTLRLIANVAVGYDNIDVPAAAARGVIVTNTPDVLTEAVADFTMALILAVTRRVAEGDRVVRAGQWKGWAFDYMLGTELRGKQLGIVGYGRIGRAVAARAAAFGMRIAFTDRDAGAQAASVAAAATRSMPGGSDSARALSLDELLVSSDVVSIHVPLTPATRHLIDRRAFARMKRSAYFVNTSRGSVVDEAAVAWALGEHLIAGAALDVFEREPEVLPDLLTLDNVVLAPHLGSATRETRAAMADLAVRNVIAVLSGEAPLTPVTGGGAT